MKSFKSALIFLAGIAVGVTITGSLTGPGVAAWAGGKAKGPFKDVPATHAAAKSVAAMKKSGILSGYPDDTYRGSEPVTRYELAVALARFAQYYDTSRQPIAVTSVNLSPAPAWSSGSRLYLAENRFVPTSSALFAIPGTNSVTADLLSDTISSTVDKLVDRSLPPSQN